MGLQWLDQCPERWPDIAEAQRERDGLVAVGGDLSVERLLAAYQRGIFPWYEAGQPICWWALAPRMVLYPHQLHISRSLAKNLRNRHYAISCNLQFDAVVDACAQVVRPEQDGTWLTTELQWALRQLHRLGHAHSFEYWQENPAEPEQWQLLGGLYGIQIGRVFFGESMFALTGDASKIAFVHATRHLAHCGVALIDCQMHTNHLARFAAQQIAFDTFTHELNHYCPQPLAQALNASLLFNQIN